MSKEETTNRNCTDLYSRFKRFLAGIDMYYAVLARRNDATLITNGRYST